jgi:hypothetical protein
MSPDRRLQGLGRCGVCPRLGALASGQRPTAGVEWRQPKLASGPIVPLISRSEFAMAGSRFAALIHAPRRFARSVVPYLSTAALLGLTAAVAFAAMGQSRVTREDRITHLPALIRAIHATAGEVEDELLIEAIFTPDVLPAGEAEAVFYRLTLPAGTSLPAPAGPFCLCRSDFVAAGVGIEIVQSGTYSLQLESPIQVQRGGASGMAEEEAAGRDTLLEPGDAAIYADYASEGTLRNAGHDPVVVLGMAIVSKEGTGIDLPLPPDGVKVQLLASSLTSDWESLPPGPVAVSLWRLRLAAATSVGPYAGAGLEALAVESGSISRRYLRLAEHTPFPALTQYPGVQSIFLAPAPGIRRSFTSGDAEPAVLLALSIEPEAVWSATLAP